MDKRKTLSIILILIITLALLPSCGGSVTPEDIEVVEDVLIVDKDTGDYTAVVIAQNNGTATAREIDMEGIALDKDGNTIPSMSDAEGTICLMPFFGTIAPGEQGVWFESTVPFGEGATIYSVYQDIPASMSWNVTEVSRAKIKDAAGIEITGVEAGEAYTDENGLLTAGYNITLQNKGKIDYKPGSGNQMSDTKYGQAWIRIICLYRDADGSIVGASELMDESGEALSLAPGESKTTKWTNVGQYYPELEPEMHISVTFSE